MAEGRLRVIEIHYLTKRTFACHCTSVLTDRMAFFVAIFVFLPPGAVVIGNNDVWPMIRIYRGGFLLVEFLFLLGKHRHTHTPAYMCQDKFLYHVNPSAAGLSALRVITGLSASSHLTLCLLPWFSSSRHQHVRLEASGSQPCAYI